MKILQPDRSSLLRGNYYPHLFQRWLFVLCLFHYNKHQPEPRTPAYHSCLYHLSECGYMRDCFLHFLPRSLCIGYLLHSPVQIRSPCQFQKLYLCFAIEIKISNRKPAFIPGCWFIYIKAINRIKIVN